MVPWRCQFKEIRRMDFRDAGVGGDGEIKVIDLGGSEASIRFNYRERQDFRAVAQTIDSLYRGGGAPLMPISTGPTIPGREILEVVDVITSEAAMGMNIFKDIANAWRDVAGGRSKSIQSTLREAREACLNELRQEARRRFADAVIGVDLDYSEFSSSIVSGGMIMVVASGTAVRLAPKKLNSDTEGGE